MFGAGVAVGAGAGVGVGVGGGVAIPSEPPCSATLERLGLPSEEYLIAHRVAARQRWSAVVHSPGKDDIEGQQDAPAHSLGHRHSMHQ